MLTTEVVKGLLAGKIYQRKGIIDGNWIKMKLKNCELFTSNNFLLEEWEHFSLSWHELIKDWEEVIIEWQEITWQEAVECDERKIPLQFLSNIDSEWIDKEKPFENCSFSFVRNNKWRKKVEGGE